MTKDRPEPPSAIQVNPPSQPVPAATKEAFPPHPVTHLTLLNLKSDPFPVVPDATNFYMPPRIESLLTEVLHTITMRRGFIVLFGDVGLGKSTFTRRLIPMLEKSRTEVALILNSVLDGVELLDEINRDFEVEVTEKTVQGELNALNRFLLRKNSEGGNCVIIIDDAQNLSKASLELVRQISNLETSTDKLVQIVLVGQTELEHHLRDHDMRQLNNRVALKAEFQPYTPEETEQYIHFKLARSGDSGQITFERRAVAAIARETSGYPRMINMLMDRCLYGLVAYKTRKVTQRLIQEVVTELPSNITPQRLQPSSTHNSHFRPLFWGALLLLFTVSGGVWWQAHGDKTVLHLHQWLLQRSEPENREKMPVTKKSASATAPTQTATGPDRSPQPPPGPLATPSTEQGYTPHSASAALPDNLHLEAIMPHLLQAEAAGMTAPFALEVYQLTGYLPLLLDQLPLWAEKRFFTLSTAN
ncbi:MAG: AAA family ATPase, partial [Gammaproteobacteria bacterium]|nr:AAA family ATPase [Gammaproteobacteria bacterium]